MLCHNFTTPTTEWLDLHSLWYPFYITFWTF